MSPPIPSPAPPQPPKLTPLTSLELRLRKLEFLVSGAVASGARKDTSSAGSTTSILRRVIEVQNELERAVEGKNSLERFLDTYPANLPLLAPRFSLSHLGLSSEDDVDLVSLETKLALVLEGETDILDVLQGLEQVDRLDKSGALGAGKLDAHRELAPRLNELLPSHRQTKTAVSDLENRLVQLLGRYDDYISTISATFIELNTLVTSAEEQVSRLEKEKRVQQVGGEY